ncbi:hypothetical protein CLOM_g8986 [Closterium sp. NIES-68]|nr:hypothetical protein CLOM_g8986 [Closterium sp. NIES-68]GJP84859.1 hypothetical protein CLOP_g14907 [Closterium sp. NIES-67]
MACVLPQAAALSSLAASRGGQGGALKHAESAKSRFATRVVPSVICSAQWKVNEAPITRRHLSLLIATSSAALTLPDSASARSRGEGKREALDRVRDEALAREREAEAAVEAAAAAEAAAEVEAAALAEAASDAEVAGEGAAEAPAKDVAADGGAEMVAETAESGGEAGEGAGAEAAPANATPDAVASDEGDSNGSEAKSPREMMGDMMEDVMDMMDDMMEGVSSIMGKLRSLTPTSGSS